MKLMGGANAISVEMDCRSIGRGSPLSLSPGPGAAAGEPSRSALRRLRARCSHTLPHPSRNCS